MTSENTLNAIEAFKLVLKYEALLRCAQEELKEAESLIPEREKKFYKAETRSLRDLSEGRDVKE